MGLVVHYGEPLKFPIYFIGIVNMDKFGFY